MHLKVSSAKLRPFCLGLNVFIQRLINSLWSIHYSDVIVGTMVSQINNLTIVYSTIYSCSDWRKHQCSTSLAFVQGIRWWLVNSPHKWPVTCKMFPFDDIMGAIWHLRSWPSMVHVMVGIWWPLYKALLIYRSHSSLNNSWKTPHSSPVRVSYGVLFMSEKVWLKFCHCNCWVVCTIVLYVTVIYQESLVQGWF